MIILTKILFFYIEMNNLMRFVQLLDRFKVLVNIVQWFLLCQKLLKNKETKIRKKLFICY